jgi:hypothetical protein
LTARGTPRAAIRLDFDPPLSHGTGPEFGCHFEAPAPRWQVGTPSGAPRCGVAGTARMSHTAKGFDEPFSPESAMILLTRRGGSLPLCLLLALATTSVASAQVVFTVDSVLDEIDDNTADGLCHTAAGSCTLRAAVMQANAVSGFGAEIRLAAATYTLVRPASGSNGPPENGDLNLTTPTVGNPLISIVGTGEATTVIDANQIDRVLAIAAGRSAFLSRLTLRRGFLAPNLIHHGAGISNLGSLTMSHCTVADNVLDSTAGSGGGIYSSGGNLQLLDSTVSGNSARGPGGGIYSAAPLILDRTTVDRNTANEAGGGIASVNTPLNISGSTISRNTSHYFGGGIISVGGSAVLVVTNSTIVLNNADDDAGGISATNASIYSSTIAFNGADVDQDMDGGRGGGIYADGAGPFNIANTLVVGNTLFDAPIYDDCYGTVTSYRRNLFWEIENGCTVAYGGGDGFAILNSLDLLGALQSNGGPTETTALLPNSNAIDLGDSTLGCTGPDGLTLASDQRGAARARGARCDVGAYESGTLFFDGFESGDLSAW